jgi:hypothetical protein
MSKHSQVLSLNPYPSLTYDPFLKTALYTHIKLSPAYLSTTVRHGMNISISVL